MTASVQLDWSSPTFLADPYPYYHRLREDDPIHRHESGFWLVMRYADAMAMLRDPRFVRPDGATPEQLESLIEQNQLSPAGFLRNYGILWQNPPDHTRLRRLFHKAFTPGVVNALRPKIEAIAQSLLDEVPEEGEVDLIASLAYPLPVIVIAELLGVPPIDRDQFRHWSRDLVGAFDPARPPGAFERGNDATAKFMDYFSDLIAERRARPQEDLLSALIAVQDEGQRLSERELLANVIFLFVAGHETTIGLLGNGILALLQHREQLIRLRDDPTLSVNAVEELLRYDSSQQTIFWTVTEPVTWEGRLFEPGQEVLIMVGAVNRDPTQFADPDRLDITRSDNRHLAFNHGSHYCLGAPLARAQAQIAIPMLFRRFPNVVLVQEPEWQKTMFIRSLKSLSVSLSG